MTIDPDILDRARQMFFQEAMDHLETLEADILALHRGWDPNRIHSLMRASHSLKGGAASFGWQGIVALAHQLETVFQKLFSGQVHVDEELESLLLEAFDHLKAPLLSQIQTGSHDSETDIVTQTFQPSTKKSSIMGDPTLFNCPTL
ncbi:MAG: hypothetical protein HC924_18165, partial [Synechococcaceae cyanobacterium SM2_3_2]|nr:hypothetical protein [Synechococcaceae cyanobacterium SM2_3_2]